jgi:hypothetical protein
LTLLAFDTIGLALLLHLHRQGEKSRFGFWTTIADAVVTGFLLWAGGFFTNGVFPGPWS